MPALVVAIGNPLRRDDGVAHQVRIPPGVDERAVLQLTPELAAEIASYNTVFFIDADIHANQVRIAPVTAAPTNSPLTHVSRPSEIVALARALFGFSGEAYTCRIPATDLSEGEGLTERASAFAEQAAREIYRINQLHENRLCPSSVSVVPGLGRSR